MVSRRCTQGARYPSKHPGDGRTAVALSTIETLDSRFARDSSSERRRDRVATASPRLVVALECRRPTALGCRLMLDVLDEVIVARNLAGRIERTQRSATVHVGDYKVSRQHLAIRRTPKG